MYQEVRPREERKAGGVDAALEAMVALRWFTGAEAEFWRLLLETFGRALDADRGWIRFGGDVGETVAAWGGEGEGVEKVEEELERWGEGAAKAVVVLEKDEHDELWREQARVFIGLFRDTPKWYELGRRAGVRTGGEGRDDFAEVVELVVLMNESRRYRMVTMVLVNELASRLGADRVTLGWNEGDYVRVQAISGMDDFGKNLDLVRKVESAMEESTDQEQVVIWPRSEVMDRDVVNRQHERLGRAKGLTAVATVPLRVQGRTVGALLLEFRTAGGMKPGSLGLVELAGCVVARRLEELKRYDRWWGGWLWLNLREWLARQLGPEHTLIKAGAVLAGGAALFLCLCPWPYKVSGNFTLKTESMVYVPAPFDGYLAEVRFKEGDAVGENEPVLRLDERELRIQEAEAEADLRRLRDQAAVMVSQSRITEMRMASAQADQAEARREMIRMRLRQSAIVAPFEGVVVESDLHERVGAPIRRGEILFRIARLEGLFAEVDIDESQVEDVREGARGELAFSSRPGERYAFLVTRIYPAARTKKDAQVFVAKLEMEGEAADWWRPGMTGVAKIEAGVRTPIWLLSRKLVDHVRLKYLWF